MTNVSEILQDELSILKNDIIERHKAAGQVASGKTLSLFETNLTSDSSGQLLGAGYVGVLESGRRPGKVPFGFSDILKRWAAAKGLSFASEQDANRWAYFVSKKIREEGTVLYRSGRNEDIFTTAIDDFSNRLSNRIGALLTEQISNEIFNFK